MIQTLMQTKYSAADLRRYFSFLVQASGNDHKHHIAPRAEFPELAAVSENIIPLSYQEHFYAHYLLALAVPECGTFQTTVRFMADRYAQEIITDELPLFAEVYERGAKERVKKLKAMHSDPAFASVRDAVAAATFKRLNADPIFIAARSERMKKQHADPIFAAMHSDNKRKHMNRLNADPVFAAARDMRSSKQMKELNADPVFSVARNARTKIANHKRWHVKRGIISTKCELCYS